MTVTSSTWRGHSLIVDSHPGAFLLWVNSADHLTTIPPILLYIIFLLQLAGNFYIFKNKILHLYVVNGLKKILNVSCQINVVGK